MKTENIETRMTKEQVQWVIAREFDSDPSLPRRARSNGELGVKIGDQIFTLYKGESIELTEGTWRPLGKRELGEVIETKENEDHYDWFQIGQNDTQLSKKNFAKSTKINGDFSARIAKIVLKDNK